MKKNLSSRIPIFSLIVLIGIQLFSCGIGYSNEKKDIITQEREVENFDGITVSGAFNVYIIQGERQRVKIEAPEELMEKIQTNVKSGNLIIGNKGIIRSYQDIKVFITVTELNTIIGSGASDIIGQGQIKLKNLRIVISGSGDIDIDISCNSLKCVLSGAGDINLKGNSENFTCVITGSGDLKAYDFISEFCQIVISGAGDAKITANIEISATVSGAGDLKYKGNAVVTNKTISGAGSIKKVD